MLLVLDWARRGGGGPGPNHSLAREDDASNSVGSLGASTSGSISSEGLGGGSTTILISLADLRRVWFMLALLVFLLFLDCDGFGAKDGGGGGGGGS